MAISIGYALQAPQLVLFSLLAVGAAANSLGGAGGPLAVLIVAIVAAECGKAVSKETKIDILVTPLVTILSGVLLSMWCAPTDGAAAVLYGYFGIGYCRRCADAADQLCSNLRGTELNRACRGRGSCGLLCADGRFCGDEF